MSREISITVRRRMVVDMRFLLGCSWDVIAQATGWSRGYCREVYSRPTQRQYREVLRLRLIDSLVDVQTLRLAHKLPPQDSPTVRRLYAHTVAEHAQAVLGGPGPARAALEAWMAKVAGGPVDLDRCPWCGARMTAGAREDRNRSN